MKKERLTKDDKIFLKSPNVGLNLPISIAILTFAILWTFCIYYFRDRCLERNYRFYQFNINMGMIILIGVVVFSMYLVFRIELLSGYKLVIVSQVKSRYIRYHESTNYHFCLENNRRIKVNKQDYESFSEGQIIKVELTPISKRTIRVNPI